MTQAALVSPHDGVGTNLYGHVLRGRLMRVVPRPQRGHQRDLDRRSRSLQLRRHLQRRSSRGADGARRHGEWKRVSWEVGARNRGARPEGRAARELGDARQRSVDGRRALSAAAAHARARLQQHRSSPAPGGFPRPGRRSGGARPGWPRHRRRRPARRAAGRRLQPAPRSAGARAPRAQGREARRQGRVPESRAFRLPVPGGRVPRVAAGEAAGGPGGYLLGLLDGAAAPKHLASLRRRRAGERRRIARLQPRSSPGRSAPSGWARWRCVIRPTPTCAPWPPAWPPPRARRSARWPKAAMPRVPISPAPCRIATRAASRARSPARPRASMLTQSQKAYLLFGGTEPWADGLGADAHQGAGAARASWSRPRRMPTRR